ncbi:ribokinase [Novosphingobium sp. Leaf2]|uniref:ribokinase n=1 Tax=Novosphingobium sp. Leaf2 TaxID=1735670 RepID=UPI0006F44EEF|nr:ribokinase [Novosphingobium sp. Leaf2]KQM14745.1 carbohydrate kinase [Novosphingobium sp. Leaf2]
MSVTVFGSLNLDIALRLPAKAGWGQTLLVQESEEAVGGKGLNQAIAAARFGSVTHMAGAVGDDNAGVQLRSALVAEGIDTAHVQVLAGQPSGRATILIEPGGDNMIAVEPAANMAARAMDALPALSAQTRVLLVQLENDVDEIARLLASAPAASLRKILNAAPAIPAGAALFGLADMLIFNQTEFADYLQLDREPETLDDVLVARRLLGRPNQAVVVTLGAIGSVAVWANDAIFSPAIPAPVVMDTSGAGDCFCGVIAACVDQGIGPQDALRLANAAASLSVRARGAAPSMPDRAAVDALVAATV